MGGKFHLRLNTGERPIANKYCEGKMKSTLKRELKGLEIVEGEGNGCRCAPCRDAGRVHSAELREKERKGKKPSGSRDKPVVFSDAFTREEILRARGMM